MKPNNFKLAICLSTIILSACGSGSDSSSTSASVDSSGNCTSQFVTDYNSVAHESRMASIVLGSQSYSSSEKASRLQSLKNACQKFFSAHGSAPSCYAEIDYKKTLVSSSNLKSNCDKAEQGLSAPTPKKPVSPPKEIKPSESEDNKRIDNSPALSSINKEQLVVKISNEQKVLRLLSNEENIAVNGMVGPIESFKDSVKAGATLCFVASPESDIEKNIRSGSELDVLEIRDEYYNGNLRRKGIITMTVGGQGIGIVCAKISSQPFTLDEIRTSLSGILELSILP